MKKSILSFTFMLAAGLVCLDTLATTRTVSNNPNRPAQFTTIQTAVTASSPNDTILITGGTYYYESVNIVIPLVFYGEAVTTTPGFPETILYGTTFNFGRLNSSLGSGGSRMYGLRFYQSNVNVNGYFPGASAGQMTTSDFIFERCDFDYTPLNFQAYEGISNITVRNCRINSYGTINFNSQYAYCGGGCFTDIIVTNCIFSSYQQYQISGGGYDFNGGILLRNNIFLSNLSSIFTSITDIVIENNIFYKAEPTGADGCTFNNNLTYLCNSNTLPYGSNFGSGNIENENPLFNNFPALGAAHDYAHNYGVQAGSPALGTGTNGSDMGVNGGNAPITNIPIWAKIPGVTVLNIPVSSVPVGGTLQIQIEAVSRD